MTDTGHEATANAIVEQIRKRREHTREVTREELPETAKAVLVKLASELDRERHERASDRARIQRLERVIARLAIEAAREGP